MKRNITLSALALSVLLLGGCAQDPGQMEYIGTESAKTLALQAAGFTSGQASFSNANMYSRNGIDYYEVSFSADGKDYRYDIDAVTGVVIENKVSSPVSKLLTEEQAKTKALAHAGLKAADVKFVECQLETDDGRSVYDIEFYSESAEYDYEIDALTGEVLDVDHDAERYTPPAPSSPSAQALLTEEQAKAKALAHAGLKAADVKFVECQLDSDDGKTTYDIEFYSGSKEYDYEVDAYTGDILDVDYDAERYSPPKNTSSGKKPSSGTSASSGTKASITAEEAKKLALAQVPGATSKDIREFETDYDDGRLEYEGTIVYEEMEYEFEIDGYSGAIRSWDVESVYD